MNNNRDTVAMESRAQKVKDPATSGMVNGAKSNQTNDILKQAAYGPVAKLKWLRTVASRPDIPRASLAACVILADMADAVTGICWPSFNTIATAIGTEPRHAKRAIAGAVDAALITVTEHGNRTRSNRYRINLDAVGSVTHDTTEGSDIQGTRVVTSKAEGSDIQGIKVVSPMTPESIHPSEHQAKDGWEISQAEGDAPRYALGGSLARQPDKTDFADFWLAVGKRSTVSETEQLLREIVASGTEYGDILAGAKRWRAYNDVTGGRRAVAPVKWLSREKWRDDWTLPQRSERQPPAATSKPTAKATKATKATSAKRTLSPEFQRWNEGRKMIDSEGSAVDERHRIHLGSCPTCKTALKAKKYDECCTVGHEMAKKSRALMEKSLNYSKVNPAPKRWIEDE